MKLIQETNEALSNIQPQQKLDFGVSDINIIMQVLSSIYSNPIATLTQEYLCNARDAHREVKQTRPIEIVCPTRLAPVLVVRDFGPGLSEKRLKEVFINYGASTKRNTNSQTGGFGIGSKSAWSYTDSFLVTSYYKGTVSTYSANKSDNIPKMELLSKEKTKEPNGVKISVSVNPVDIAAFKSAILKATHFWETAEKPIIKNIAAEEIPEQKEKLFYFEDKDFTFFLTKSDNYSKNTWLLMDGISYPINNHNLINANNPDVSASLCRSAHTAYIKVNTGTFAPTPSREELEYSTETRQKLLAIFKRIQTKISNDYTQLALKDEGILAKASEYCEAFDWRFLPTISQPLYQIKNDRLYLTTANKGNIYRTSTTRKGKLRQAVVVEGVNCDKGCGHIYEDSPGILKKNTRLAAYAKTSDKHTLYVYSGIAPELAKHLGLIDLSSLPLPIGVPTKRTNSRTKATRELCLHYVDKYLKTTAIQLNINQITTKHYYYSISDYVTDKTFITYLVKRNVNTICYIAPSKLKLIQNNPLFMPLTEYEKNYKLSDNEYKSVISEEICSLLSSPVVHSLLSMKGTINAAIDYVKRAEVSRYEIAYLPAIKQDHPLMVEYLSLKESIKQIPIICPMLALVKGPTNKTSEPVITAYITQCYSNHKGK